MEIIEYIPKYDEQIKDLLVDLQNYLIDIDDWHTQIMYPNYREDYFKYEIDLIKMQEGKIYLALENNMVVGLIIGKVSKKDQIDKLTNDCAKIGDIIELIVKKDYRKKKIGQNLLLKIEEYFKNINCERINVEVFGPNKNALDFYFKNNYIIRDYIVSKKI